MGKATKTVNRQMIVRGYLPFGIYEFCYSRAVRARLDSFCYNNKMRGLFHWAFADSLTPTRKIDLPGYLDSLLVAKDTLPTKTHQEYDSKYPGCFAVTQAQLKDLCTLSEQEKYVACQQTKAQFFTLLLKHRFPALYQFHQERLAENKALMDKLSSLSLEAASDEKICNAYINRLSKTGHILLPQYFKAILNTMKDNDQLDKCKPHDGQQVAKHENSCARTWNRLLWVQDRFAQASRPCLEQYIQRLLQWDQKGTRQSSGLCSLDIVFQVEL